MNELRRRSGLFATLDERLGSTLWFVPSVIVALTLLLAWGTLRLDERLEQPVPGMFGGGPTVAIDVLSTIATATMTITGVLFSITVVALQLVSSQFSPRALRNFLRDRVSQVALGVFVGTYAYTLTVLSGVRPPTENGAFVPSVSVTAAIVLALLSVVMFVVYISHTAQSVRVASLVRAITRETVESIDRLCGEHVDDPELCTDYGDDPRQAEAAFAPGGNGRAGIAATEDRASPAHRSMADGGTTTHRGAQLDRGRIVRSDSDGYVVQLEAHRLVRHARRADARVQMLVATGDFVYAGMPIARVDGSGLSDEGVRSAIRTGRERTMQQDFSFGLRELVDIGQRAMSPSVNDPTTTTQVVDRVHEILALLCRRPLPPHVHRDDDGMVRVTGPAASWSDVVHLAFDELRMVGGESLQVSRRLRAALANLLEIAPPGRRPPLQQQLDLLDELVQQTFTTQADLNYAGSVGQGVPEREARQ